MLVCELSEIFILQLYMQSFGFLNAVFFIIESSQVESHIYRYIY